LSVPPLTVLRTVVNVRANIFLAHPFHISLERKKQSSDPAVTPPPDLSAGSGLVRVRI